MLKAALPLVPGLSRLPGVAKVGSELPGMVLTRHDVRVDPGHLARYREVCGFPRKDVLPVTYPQALAFPMQLAVLTDRAFPLPAIGTVHLENSLTQLRPLAVAESLQLTVRPAALRPHAKGRAFDLVTTVHCAGELVWEATATFLRRGAGDTQASEGSRFDDPPPGTVEWQLPADLGRRYAAVSGDYNPIHLYAPTTRAFGFRRQIAHGMWSKARCLAAVENRLPDAVRVDVAFRKPVLLPGAVSFGTDLTPAGRRFALTSPRDGAVHLVGRAHEVE